MHLAGMSAGSGVGVSRRPGHPFRSHRMNVATLLLLLSWGVGGGVRAMPRGLASPSQFQDPAASLPILDEVAVAEIREHLANAEPQEREQRLALLYQLIKQYMAEAGATGDARMAIPPPLLHSAAANLRMHPGHQMADAALLPGAAGEDASEADDVAEEENKPKRVSSAYMSLCHFKICNMGRKRNYRYPTPWVRV
ncbi:uncharacterized protein LOC124159107 isoform X2 [Ischnura elegans]|uniref:uncharacterized protein LOC124159107 isoform X2 n=1 Tax=Ischnura elegans TaxID=197161 RepID=UPI001ED8715A|nr:uncharacterized protein LOC124159107 isoform X2 [Ischnura elegans]